MSGLLLAVTLSLVAGAAATSVGALPVAFFPKPHASLRSVLSGFAAGIMLSASIFSLAVPALAMRVSTWGPSRWTLLPAALAFLAGAAMVDGLNRVVPHEHFVKGPEGLGPGRFQRVWLFVLAMTLHNFPEGMAVGVGSVLDWPQARSLATAIALQNVPEGLVVAAALWDKGYRRSTAVLVGCASGAVEPIGAALGYGAIALSRPLLPAALLFAAGAMVYVVASEVLPESQEGGSARLATWATLLGFTLNMALDALAA